MVLYSCAPFGLLQGSQGLINQGWPAADQNRNSHPTYLCQRNGAAIAFEAPSRFDSHRQDYEVAYHEFPTKNTCKFFYRTSNLVSTFRSCDTKRRVFVLCRKSS
mmetsp:Transcript_21869/g.48889  ORF Transcript_21869/g.48889 Transcript_21869/m.48889 type:complete len:104 (+) Transcript_21869:66-377(+)